MQLIDDRLYASLLKVSLNMWGNSDIKQLIDFYFKNNFINNFINKAEFETKTPKLDWADCQIRVKITEHQPGQIVLVPNGGELSVGSREIRSVYFQ